MEGLNEEEIDAELSSNDNLKITSGLSKLLQLATSSRDLSSYFSNVLEVEVIYQRGSNKVIKLLGFNCFFYCHNSLDSHWEKLLELLLKEINSEDPDIKLILIKLLEVAPTHLSRNVFNTIHFDELLEDSNALVRKQTIDTLTTLLLCKDISYLDTQQGLALWESIIDRLVLDKEEVVILASFKSLYDLLNIISEDDLSIKTKSNITSTKRNQLSQIYSSINSKLYANFWLIVLKFSSLKNKSFWCVYPITHLTQVLYKSHDIQLRNTQVIDIIVEQHYLPLLHSMDESLVYSICCNILLLSSVIKHSHSSWIISVVETLLQLLQRENPTFCSYQVVKQVQQVLEFLDNKYFVRVAFKLLIAIKNFTDTSQRMDCILKIFSLGINVQLSSSSINFLELLFKEPWFQSIWKIEADYRPFREEILIILISILMEKLCSKDSSKYFALAQQFVLLTEDVIFWDPSERNYIIIEYLKFLDNYLLNLNISSTLSSTTISDLIDKFSSKMVLLVKNETLHFRILAILCKYGSEDQIVKSPTLSVLKQSVIKHKERQIDLPVLLNIEMSLSIYLILNSRFPNLLKAQIKEDILSFITLYSENTLLKDRFISTISKLDVSFSPNLYLDMALSTNDIDKTKEDVNLLLELKKITLEDRFVLSSEIVPNKYSLLTGTSDPICVLASHSLNQMSNILSFILKLCNISGIPIFNFKVNVSTTGQMEPLSNNYSSSTNIKSIAIQETLDIKFDFYLKNFDSNNINVEIILQDPEERSLDSLYAIHCLPYTIGFTQLIVPLSYNLNEFEEEWNKAPSYFIIKVKIKETLECLLNTLESNRFSKIFEWKYHSSYFQIGLAAVSLFNDKLLLKIIGQITPTNLSCTLEFHGEPHILSVVQPVQKLWLQELFGDSIAVEIKDLVQ